MKCKHGARAPEVISKLPENQAGRARHRCAVCAYDAGLRAGLAEAAGLLHDLRVKRGRR